MTNPTTLVLDVGKTNVKLLVMSKTGEILDKVRRDNASVDQPPYSHLDVDGNWRWMLESIHRLTKSYTIDAIVPTTHGSTAALVAGQELLLPIPDYEAEIPAEIENAFQAISPPFTETYSPDLPAGLNLGKQLFWLQSAYPEAFARTEWILTYPQYWAWRLSGVPASETTSLGCHSHLWNPLENRFSSLVDNQNWARLFPPPRAAFDALGPVSEEVRQSTGLPSACQVFCGIHDANAAFSLYLRGCDRPFSLLSTGTWVATMSPRQPLDRLDAKRDTLAIVDINGKPLPIGRFMGGREFEVLTRDSDSRDFADKDLRAVIGKRSFLLPSFAPAGPFMGREGSSVGPEPESSDELVARATLYLALMTVTSMRMLGMDGDLMIDGGFVKNSLYCRLLATLGNYERCFVNHQTEGTAVGAGMLAVWHDSDTAWPLELRPVEKLDLPGLADYASQWREHVDHVSSEEG
jgi:sugar (pentulose or hexulose) kinase